MSDLPEPKTRLEQYWAGILEKIEAVKVKKKTFSLAVGDSIAEFKQYMDEAISEIGATGKNGYIKLTSNNGVKYVFEHNYIVSGTDRMQWIFATYPNATVVINNDASTNIITYLHSALNAPFEITVYTISGTD